MNRYRWIGSQEADGFPVITACRVSEVSTSSYYEWKARLQAGPTAAEMEEQMLVSKIREIHSDSDGAYGSPRITAELHRFGYCVNHKRVEQLMQKNGIVGVTPRRRVRTTIADKNAPPLPDLARRRFAPGAPNVAWAGDITYIPTGEGWLYLSSVLDLGSRRLLGWEMDDCMPTALVGGALTKSCRLRGFDVEGVIFHSDRGSQYMSTEYRDLCLNLGIRQSVGRVATCFDNAVAESFWSSLKRELIHRYRFATRAEAKAAIEWWIHRYNSSRLHSTLGYVPPIEWELLHNIRSREVV